MFEVGDLVVCGNNGICSVERIGTIDISGIDPDRQYYILEQIGPKSSIVYIPVDADKIVMRKVLTKEEAISLADQIPEIAIIDEKIDKKREERFKECMKLYDCTAWISMIKTLNARRVEREEKGQKVTATDARYMKLASDNLFSEFSVALDMERTDVEEYLNERFEKVLSQ